MFKQILIFILAISPLSIFSQEIKEDKMDVKPTIYLLGSVHNMHFNPDKHYSINDLLAQISALKPDLVCGEITPEAFNQSMEGYFPPEATFLAEMANELNYRFVPVDWRLDYSTQTAAYKEFPATIQEQRAVILKKLQHKLNTSNNPSLYDTLHDKTFLNDLDSLYENIIGVNALAEIASGSWHERNRRVVENALSAVGNAKTIVFVLGIDHIPQLQRQLRILGIEAQIPLRMFVPSDNYMVSKVVIERWKRNLENLQLIRDKKIPATYDDYQKVVNSKRIENLEEAIQKSL